MRCLGFLLLVACQSSASPPVAAARQVIEVRERGAVTARIVAGHPCRATVDGTELLVGGRPLVAQNGATRWTGEDLPNGTTLKKNDAAVARIHAKQLFDAEGVPLVRVTETGDIANSAGRIIAKPVVSAGPTPTITIDTLVITGLTGASDELALAAMLTASGVEPEIRALAACHYLLPDAPTGKH